MPTISDLILEWEIGKWVCEGTDQEHSWRDVVSLDQQRD